MPEDAARTRALAATDWLIYAQGIQAVGMDAIRAAAGVPLKSLYQLFGSKEALVVAALRERDERWRRQLREYVDALPTPEARILGVFDWLHAWFQEPDYRGCAFVNSFGELGASSDAVAAEARRHKELFRDYLHTLATDAGHEEAADHLFLLAEGAIVASAMLTGPEAALTARIAAAAVLREAASTVH